MVTGEYQKRSAAHGGRNIFRRIYMAIGGLNTTKPSDFGTQSPVTFTHLILHSTQWAPQCTNVFKFSHHTVPHHGSSNPSQFIFLEFFPVTSAPPPKNQSLSFERDVFLLICYPNCVSVEHTHSHKFCTECARKRHCDTSSQEGLTLVAISPNCIRLVIFVIRGLLI